MTRSSRFRVPVTIVVLVCLLATGGCQASVRGSGEARRPVSSSVVPTSGTSTVGHAPISPRYRRTPVSTGVGDPATADLCGALDARSLQHDGITPSFGHVFEPPSCYISYLGAGRIQTEVTVTGLTAPDGHPGRRRVRSGLTIIAGPYQPSVRNCERQILAGGIVLRVSLQFAPDDEDATTFACTLTDAVTTQLVTAVATRSVPRLPLANPSVSDLDFCRVLTAVGRSRLAILIDARIDRANSFGSTCELASSKYFLIASFDVAERVDASSYSPVVVGDHRLLHDKGDEAGQCGYTSVQGVTSKGGREEIQLFSGFLGLARGDKSQPDQCTQTARLLAQFLDEAGLR